MSELTAWQQKLSDWVRTACYLEVSAPKPGNVNPEYSFSSLDEAGVPRDVATVEDFLRSADAICDVAARVTPQTVGSTILECIRATRLVVPHNTNLGIVLLLIPLAAVPESSSLQDGIERILDDLTVDDSMAVYEAIRLAAPGGLGNADDQDVSNSPTLPLRDCMRLASERDTIAMQYVNAYQEVFRAVDWLENSPWIDSKTGGMESASTCITWLALRLLQSIPDTLIIRKCGVEVATEARRLADQVLVNGWPEQPSSEAAYEALKKFLCEDGHRRNPGTTADLIVAALFCGLRSGRLRLD
ncbi:MAG: triphosphoribosyl-dephospho-CoA synthase [Planctomycetaceae bacterium]|nr:triphosphoribosyl-dephospho-CoA synthase [Planctomycetaceae bacterium]